LFPFLLSKRGLKPILNVLLFIFIRDLDVSAIRLEVNQDRLAEYFILVREIHHPLLNVMIQHPHQTAVDIIIHIIHISERDLLSQNHLVDRANEEGVEEETLENGEADHAPNELEVGKMLRVNARVWVDLKGVLFTAANFKEAVGGIEHFMGEEEEEFSAKSISDSSKTTPNVLLT
jgi:hypothetical protein